MKAKTGTRIRPFLDEKLSCTGTGIRVEDFTFGNWDLGQSKAGNCDLGQISAGK